MHRNAMLYDLSQDPPDEEVFTVAVLTKFNKHEVNAGPPIILNVKEGPATPVTSLVSSRAITKAVRGKLTSMYQKKSI